MHGDGPFDRPMTAALRLRRTRMLGLALILPLLALAVAAPPIAGALPPGAALSAPSFAHPLGTDDLGRDMLSAIAEGARTSFLVGGLATALALLLGTLLGISAAFGTRLADDVVMRSAEITVTVPPVLLAIVTATLVGNNAWITGLAVGFGFWPTIARIARAAGLALRGQPHVLAARALGGSPAGIAVRHVLPAILPVVLATTGVVFGGAVLAEATLSFVGLGDPSVASWGRLVADAGPYLREAWWLWLFPGLALVGAATGVGLALEVR